MAIQERDVIIIGGGPAGLAAAVALRKLGVDDILVIEREQEPGGILRQCIHDGFGLTRFGEALSGPEYAARFSDEADRLQIPIQTGTMVTELHPDRTVFAVSPEGVKTYRARAVVLAMGCRERSFGAIRIPGTRPSGIYTAGVAQTAMNLKNLRIGNEAVILGSGDIGLIMARRLTLEGSKVLGVFELRPYAGGLPRNIEQCLNDYDIPLHLSHTVTQVHGTRRLEGVTVSQVNEQGIPLPVTDRYMSCDTLILSVGLIPENELSRMAGVDIDPRTGGPSVDETYQTGVSGIFAAGNVLHVHDLVDFVSLEAERLAQSVSDYLSNAQMLTDNIEIIADPLLGYTVPQHVRGDRDFTLSFRVNVPMRELRFTILQGDILLQSVMVRKALPAEMIHIPVFRTSLASREAIRVVTAHE